MKRQPVVLQELNLNPYFSQTYTIYDKLKPNISLQIKVMEIRTNILLLYYATIQFKQTIVDHNQLTN